MGLRSQREPGRKPGCKKDWKPEQKQEKQRSSLSPCSLVFTSWWRIPLLVLLLLLLLLLLGSEAPLGSDCNRQIQSLPHCVMMFRWCGYSGGWEKKSHTGEGKEGKLENPNEREQQFGWKRSVSQCVISQSSTHAVLIPEMFQTLFTSVQNNNKEYREWISFPLLTLSLLFHITSWSRSKYSTRCGTRMTERKRGGLEHFVMPREGEVNAFLAGKTSLHDNPFTWS